MNRYKIALGYEAEAKKMDPDLETRLRRGAAAWMENNLTDRDRSELDRRSEKALILALRLFPNMHSEDCIKTAADFMHLDEDKLNKLVALIKSGK